MFCSACKTEKDPVEFIPSVRNRKVSRCRVCRKEEKKQLKVRKLLEQQRLLEQQKKEKRIVTDYTAPSTRLLEKLRQLREKESA
jgi:hypothetical protein